jgi:preprotein translocase subunit SecG
MGARPAGRWPLKPTAAFNLPATPPVWLPHRQRSAVTSCDVELPFVISENASMLPAPMLTFSIYFVATLLVITCLLIVLLVLMQRPKQEGLGAAFGAGVTDQIWGSQTTNVLQKGTVYLGVLFFLLSLTLCVLEARKSRQFVGMNVPTTIATPASPSSPATTTSTPFQITPQSSPTPPATPAGEIPVPATGTPAPATGTPVPADATPAPTTATPAPTDGTASPAVENPAPAAPETPAPPATPVPAPEPKK